MRERICRHGCGGAVYQFSDDVGCPRQVNVAPLGPEWPTTHPALRHRLWRYRSPWVGWIPVPYLGEEVIRLAPGPIHVEHNCEKTPRMNRPITDDLTSVLSELMPRNANTYETK